ncbi:MAG TPA: polyprenyl synthetase family protein [Anaerolineales bacterium]|nr:polyprenyl synthetase family protein [Anaerolineales bacterium]
MNEQINIPDMRTAIEQELHRSIESQNEPELDQYFTMLAYHMGWEGEGAGPDAQGKRIRPLLVLLTCAAAGGEWQNALPAAAAVELVHNFSLIHDDIQDNSPLRRGRETVWKRWGIAQAINTGDAMLTIAHLSLLQMEKTSSPEIANQAAHTLQRACLQLTKGQYLDLAFESRISPSMEAYWLMVGGKTAALLGACTELGAIAAVCSDARRKAFRDFGYHLGLAFQAQDDILGIWGDAALTGKSNESDLIAGKKSLPVIYGLNQDGQFKARWNLGSIVPSETESLAEQLESEGAYQYTQDSATRMTEQALQALALAKPDGEAGVALKDLTKRLLNREA